MMIFSLNKILHHTGVSVIVENVGGPELAEFGRPNVSGVIDDRLNEPTSPPPTLLLGDTEFLDWPPAAIIESGPKLFPDMNGASAPRFIIPM